jgi:hypothetical protein
MEDWWRHLGTPALTPELRGQLNAGMREALHGRSQADLAQERDQLLLALIETLQQERRSLGTSH